MNAPEHDHIGHYVTIGCGTPHLFVDRSFVRNTLRAVPPIVLRVREIREARGLSQDRLAASSGVTQAAISRIERGETTSVDLDVLDRLARALDVDPGMFFTRYCP